MVCDSVCVCVHPPLMSSPPAAKGPIDVIFGMGMYIDDRMPIFSKPRSQVKGQGQKRTKNRFLQRLLVTGGRFWSIQDRRGSHEVPLAACQLILAACQKLQNDRGRHLEMSPNTGRLPGLLARCQIWKNSQAEVSRDSAMRGVPLHIYYIQFGQCTHPMGHGRPPWAAGEQII